MKQYLRKRYIVPLILIIVIAAIALITPNLVDFVKNGTKSVIDYTVDAMGDMNKDGASDEDSSFMERNLVQDGLSNRIVEINFGSEKLSFNTNYTNEIYEINSLYTDAPIQVEFDDSTTGSVEEYSIYINGQEVDNGDSINVDSLTKDSYIEVEIEYNDSKRKYYIQTLPSDFPEIEKHGKSKNDGEYYSNFYLEDSSYIYKMSNDGEILYYKRDNGRNKLSLFTKWNFDGKVRYSYFYENNKGTIDENSYNYGDMIILDENYEVIDIVNSVPSQKYNINLHNNAEAHDFIMIDDGHYMLMNYVIDTPNQADLNESLNMDTRVLAAYLQEIKDGEVVWEWISTDYPEFYESSVEGNDYSNSDTYAQDYMHINSMFIDPNDGNVIMSFRNQDSVVKVDKSTNEIMWTLGGENDDFSLSEEQIPSRQHHATLTDSGNLILFDNGTNNEQTRILEYELDEENNEILNFEEFVIEGAYSQFTGSVQKIDEENDVFVIGWGMGRNQPAMMSEVDFKNNTVLSEVIEPDMQVDSYRFLKIE